LKITIPICTATRQQLSRFSSLHSGPGWLCYPTEVGLKGIIQKKSRLHKEYGHCWPNSMLSPQILNRNMSLLPLQHTIQQKLLLQGLQYQLLLLQGLLLLLLDQPLQLLSWEVALTLQRGLALTLQRSSDPVLAVGLPAVLLDEALHAG